MDPVNRKKGFSLREGRKSRDIFVFSPHQGDYSRTEYGFRVRLGSRIHAYSGSGVLYQSEGESAGRDRTRDFSYG